MFPYRIAVCAATDPTNGAGLCGDILTIQSLGEYPLSVVTAITVQDTIGVKAVYPAASEVVAAQWCVLTEDIKPQAVKWGMVGSFETLMVLKEAVGALSCEVPIVIDPVLASGRGDRLADEATRHEYRYLNLSQKIVVLTPNYREFYRIMDASEEADVKDLIRAFFSDSRAPAWLLLKGVHAPTQGVTHTLWGKHGQAFSVECPRLSDEYHGSGCTLASALAVFLARGHSVEHSLGFAQTYTWKSLQSALYLGNGQALPNRAVGERNDV